MVKLVLRERTMELMCRQKLTKRESKRHRDGASQRKTERTEAEKENKREKQAEREKERERGRKRNLF